MSELHPAAEAAFPPATIEDFLRFCGGEWMSLRSRFNLESSDDGDANDSWHSSERGELVVQYLDPLPSGGPGGLRVTPKQDGTLQSSRSLVFATDGSFSGDDDLNGHWTLWPDGSLELVVAGPGTERREKIWFTKPNLRLRSTLENRSDGSPGQASFCAEIRRVSRPS